MKVQILSDLNLKEGDAWNAIVAKESTIFLLGNIAPISLYKTIIESLSWSFEHIIIIPGVLEYSSVSSIQELSEKLASITSDYPNVKVLIRDTISIQGINIIGLTLWSPTLPYAFPIAYLTPKDTKKLAKDDVSWLSSKLSQSSSVVFTHFPPMESRNNAVCSWAHHADVEHMVSNPPVAIWLHPGNCKGTCIYTVSGTQVVIPPPGKDVVVELLVNNIGNSSENGGNHTSKSNEEEEDVEINGNYETSEKAKQETNDIIQKLLSKKMGEDGYEEDESKTKKRYFEQTQTQTSPTTTTTTTTTHPIPNTKIVYTDEDELESFLKSSDRVDNNHPSSSSSPSSSEPLKEKKKKTFKF